MRIIKKIFFFFFITLVIIISFVIYQFFCLKISNKTDVEYIEDTIVLPFKFINGKIILKGKVNNKEVKWLIDTGASSSIIYNNDKFSFFYLVGIDINHFPFFTKVINLSHLKIGDIEINNSYFRSIQNQQKLYDGIIGNNILKNYNILFDFENKTLSISSKKEFILKNNIVSNYKFKSNKIFVKIMENTFLLDTGANNVISINSDSLKQKVKYLQVYGKMLKGITNKANSNKEYIAEIHDFIINDSTHIDTIQLYTSKMSKNIIGTGFLKNYYMAINYKNESFYMQKNSENDFIYNKLGFRIDENNSIDYVIEKSIADKNGLKVGQVVLKINGKRIDYEESLKVNDMDNVVLTIKNAQGLQNLHLK